MAQLRFPPVRSLPELRYVRAPEPLEFPEDALRPESKTHLVLRTFLFRLLRFALGPAHRVGSEQFLYWNAADPTVSLAPDAMVRLYVPDAQFKTWKTWEEGGVPDPAIEVVSDSDRRGWSEKLSDYRAIGVKELVRFDPAAPDGKRLQVWDRVREARHRGLTAWPGLLRTPQKPFAQGPSASARTVPTDVHVVVGSGETT
jgi:hypothetical protein